jgi:PAS domain S-box-containing protein
MTGDDPQDRCMGGRILIVEDGRFVAARLKKVLTRLGYDVLDIVAFGEEALPKLDVLSEAGATLPDLVLMDINLAGDLSGIEAAAQIHASYDIPVIYLTTHADDTLLQRARVTEPYGYLVNPVQDRELHATIEMALYRHKLEMKLKERERWLDTTLRSIGDAVIATDQRGWVTFMNLTAEKLTGWKQTEALRHDLTEVLHIVNATTGELAENPVTKVLQEGTSTALAKHTTLVAKGGTEIPIDDSAALVRDDKGNVTGAVLTFRDVTAQARADEALRERTRQLEMTFEELDASAYSIAHDLRSPLRAIKGFPQILLDDYAAQLPPEAQDYLKRIGDAAERMSKLIDGLLAFLRLMRRPLEKRTVSPTDLVHKALANMPAELVDRDVTLTVAELPPCQADPALLEQVLSNLLSNALKYTRQREKARITVGWARQGDQNVYFVQDNGVGFDMQYAHKLFGMFERLHHRDEYEGTGIGLAIAQRIVERHGGRIWAEAQIDQGATFYFTL